MIRILRDYMPNADAIGEDIVPSAWRHAGARCGHRARKSIVTD
jgi:hypothetical protein